MKICFKIEAKKVSEQTDFNTMQRKHGAQMWETAGENLSTRERNITTNPIERAEPLQSKPSVSFRSRQDGGKYF